jgi:two-component system alkaline phosphatase synthesis response regulator PhoP
MSAPSNTGSTPPKRKAKILIVDDDVDLTYALHAMLEEAGFEVQTASDGRMGLEMTRKFDPDLVILDVMMPEMDGFEVCREFKRVWGPSRPKILLLSGITAGLKANVPAILEQSLADSFVEKPYKALVLLNEIDRLLLMLK